MHLIFLVALLTACLPKNHHEAETTNPLDDLRAKYIKVLEQSKTNLSPETGWPLDVSCDGLTFTTIYSLAGGESDPFKAESMFTPGMYYRDANHLCGPDHGSVTTQSQDAFIMLATKLWREKDLARINDIIAYVELHDRYVGEPQIDQARMSSPVLNTYKVMRALLMGDTPPPPDTSDPITSGQQLTGVLTGFRAHLLVWHVYDRGIIYGALNELEYQALKYQAERQPRNVLYSAMYNKFTHGDQSDGIAELMESAPDGVCSTMTQCVPYRWSTDDTPSDWDSCPDEHHTFTCIDWLIAAKIILGDI